MQNSRQKALLALREIQQGAFADVALDRALGRGDTADLDRRLVTELVYGTVRRQKTLDALIDQLARKKSSQHPPDLRLILHLGLYQLRYLNQIPPSAAVNTTVELTKQNGLSGLSGFVNGLMRQYLRLSEQGEDPLQVPEDPIARFAIQHSYPEWIVQVWFDQFGLEETEKLCEWFNQPPHIDLRVNLLRTTVEDVAAAMSQQGIETTPVAPLPSALRLVNHVGAIWSLPGFEEGWWTVQDSSSQLVAHLLDPQPGETIIDACAAPGGKATHTAELMGDRGLIWACDRTPSRLRKLTENAQRLHITSIQHYVGDSREAAQFKQQGDRVLLDAPCSGLGTLHRHADARWRQTPDTVQELATLQQDLLTHTATWVKPGGILLYSTCTLHPLENEQRIQTFLAHHPGWHIEPPAPHEPTAPFVTPQGWLKVSPPSWDMDGFFMVKLRKAE